VASRTGLLPFLTPEPSSPRQIAARSGLHRRYVEEILSTLACGKIVELTRDSSSSAENGAAWEPLYSMAADCKAALDGMALYFEEMPLLVRCAFDEVVTDAKEGKGVPYSCYGPFGAWMGKLADEKHESQLVEKFIPALGEDVVSALRVRNDARILDIGCGEGTAACLMARAFPNSRVVGVDAGAASVEAAAEKAKRHGLTNVEFFVGDAAALDQNSVPSDCFDLITAFDVIHDLSNPTAALREVCRALRPDTGTFAMVDIRAHTHPHDNLGHSFAPFLYAVSLMHCMPQGLRDGGPGLGMMWGREQALEMVEAAGLKAKVLELDFDTFNDCYLCRCPSTSAAGT